MADNITIKDGAAASVIIAAKDVSSVYVPASTPVTPANVTMVGTAGTAAAGVMTMQGIASMTPVQVTWAAAATSIAKAEDVASADADVGVPAMMVRKLTPANSSGTDGDYEFIQGHTGQQWINAGRWTNNTNGVLATAFATVQGSGTTNGLDALTSGAAATSASGYSQTNTLGAKEALVYYLSGDTTWTPAGAGANIAVWFLLSDDGGSTYESAQNTASTTVPALSRPPDAIIPLDLVATGTAGVKKYATGSVKLPPTTFKVVAQNNGGATMGDTTTTHAAIYIVPVA